MDSLKPYLILVAAWAFYLFLHSAMAASRCKNVFYELGFGKRGYRIFYSILASVLLLILLVFNGMVRGPLIFPKSRLVSYIGLFLGGGGLFVLRAAFRQYSLGEFLGIRTQGNGELRTGGILSVVRHPIYSATILITLGFLLYDPRLPTLISMSCIWIYLPLGIYFEERKLLAQFGEKYRRYKQQVPAVIPGLPMKKSL